jgi:hypothetical protein
VLTLIHRARRRWLNNELLSQGANAFSAALIAFILLLLLGTEVLNWEWLLAIPLAAALFGIYLARRRTPESYRIAQLVDQRLSLADTLSTAWFFQEHQDGARSSPEIRQCQLERALRLSASLDVRRAVPYTMPRTVYLLAALVLVASSLFALRYGISRKLDLRPPLAAMLQQEFGWKPRTQVAKADRRKVPPKAADQQDDNTAAPDEKNGQDSPQPDAAQNEDAQSAQQQSDEKKANPQGDPKQQADSAKKSGEEGEAEAEEKTDSSTDPSDNPQQNGSGKQDQAQSGSKQQDANSSENSSLLSKVKDAVQNLLSRVKPQQGNQGSQQQAGADQGQKQQGKPNGGKQQQSAKNGQQSGEQKGDSEEGQAGDEAQQQSQDQQGKGAGKSDTRQASKQPGSGIGSQDGDKSIKQAEQLSAMGKISEILGKRSANISGESTVEVQSTNQQLKTQYVQRSGEHTQGGAEISRDEVPVSLQSFVEQYFEQVRKQPAPAATVKKQN